ncbi:MAG: hypothetical protein M1814_002351 [Vezdaea aestivalis]|nr:MAG: hypothetical protein M1814_002351 [Vezdaea aestivalis]
MAAGSGWKRPWENPPSSQEPPIQLTQAPVPTTHYEQVHRQLTHQTQFSNQPSNRTLPPIVPPQYKSSAAVTQPNTPVAQNYSPIAGHRSYAHHSQPPSPKRQRTSLDQHADSLAYAKWLESSSPGGPLGPGTAGSMQSDFSNPSSRYPRPVSLQALGEPLGVLRSSVPARDIPSRSQTLHTATVTHCENCGNMQGITEEVVHGVTMLERELKSGKLFEASRPPGAGIGGISMQAPNVAQIGIKDALEWTASVLRAHIGQVRSINSNRTAHGSQPSEAGQTQPIDQMRRRIDSLERERDDALMRVQRASTDDPRTPDISSVSSAFGQHQRRRSLLSDPASLVQSPVRPTTFSQMAAPPARVPQSPTTPSLAPLPPLNTTTNSAMLSPTATHIQDLQHKVSTKTLALQSLQQEHDHLLAALSRAQSRCSTLERKFQASDDEITNLSDERTKLSVSVEALEGQVESLLEARDEARKQSVVNGGQYMKIMSMASKLEAQAATDKRKWKSTQDAWTTERISFETQIARLEKERAEAIDMAVSDSSPVSDRALSEASDARTPIGLRKTSAINASTISPPLTSILSTTAPVSSPLATSVNPTSTSAPRLAHESSTSSGRSNASPLAPSKEDTILESGSLEQLRDEILRLRHSCAEMEYALSDLRTEGQRIDQVIKKFGNIGKRVSTKAEQIRVIAAGAK